MNTSDSEAYIDYRIGKANEAYAAAILLAENKQWNAAMNRLYYAAYYSVGGLLVQYSVETKTHAGVKSQFLLHFVKTGKVPIAMGKLYADLFDWRQRGDYGDFFDFEADDILPLLEPTRLFIDTLITMMANSK